MNQEKGGEGYDIREKRTPQLVDLRGLFLEKEERMNPAQKVERCAGRFHWLARINGACHLIIDVGTREKRREEIWRIFVVGASFVYRRVA